MRMIASMRPVWATVIIVGALTLAGKAALAEPAAKAPAVIDGDSGAVSATGSVDAGQVKHADAADIRAPQVVDPDIHDVDMDVREPEIESPDFQVPQFDAPDVPVAEPDLPDIPESH